LIGVPSSLATARTGGDVGNGEEIRGDTVEGDPAPIPKHHEKLDRALQKAVDAIPAGEPAWYEVRYMVHVRHSSPGWVDGYSVRLTPSG
jgi:hypothetical protein